MLVLRQALERACRVPLGMEAGGVRFSELSTGLYAELRLRLVARRGPLHASPVPADIRYDPHVTARGASGKAGSGAGPSLQQPDQVADRPRGRGHRGFAPRPLPRGSRPSTRPSASAARRTTSWRRLTSARGTGTSHRPSRRGRAHAVRCGDKPGGPPCRLCASRWELAIRCSWATLASGARRRLGLDLGLRDARLGWTEATSMGTARRPPAPGGSGDAIGFHRARVRSSGTSDRLQRVTRRLNSLHLCGWGALLRLVGAIV